jgi:hypothetical protein
MANKVLLKKSSVAAKVPLPSDLSYGELAVNYADAKLYFKDSVNAIQYFVSTGSTDTLTNKTLSSAILTGTLTAGGGVGTNGQLLQSTGTGVQWVTSAAGGGTTTNALTIGTGLSGTSFNGSTAVTIAIDSTVVTLTGTQTLTNKSIAFGSNTITGTLAQLNTAITDADVAATTHKYHEFTLNAYYYDSYYQDRYFRLFTQNATYDTARYSPVTNVEYWNGTAWVAWVGGDAYIKNLLDGRDNTYADIDHTHRKFRFTINKNSGWPTNAIIATYMSWYGNGWTPFTLTIEDTADQVTWTTKETLTFGNTTNTNADYGWHAFYSGNLHNGRTLNRITYDITDWTDSGAYVTKPIYALSIFSNYNGASDSIGVPVSWNYDKVVNFSAIPTVSSVQVATISASQTLTNKTISGSSNTLSNIGNSSLTNSSVTIGSTAVSLGGTATTIAGLTSVTSTTFVGALTGNATTATTLATARAIYGNNFDGSAALTQVIAGTYGGTGVNNGSNTITVAGNVSHAGAFTQTFTATGNTSVTLPTSGTLLTTAGSGSSLTFGTGSLSLAGNLTTSGAFATTITTTAATSVTLPTTGTLATLAGSETFTNKTLSSAVITGTVTAGGVVGTAGQVLSSTGTGVQWVAPSAGGGLSVDESIIYSMIF